MFQLFFSSTLKEFSPALRVSFNSVRKEMLKREKDNFLPEISLLRERNDPLKARPENQRVSSEKNERKTSAVVPTGQPNQRHDAPAPTLPASLPRYPRP